MTIASTRSGAPLLYEVRYLKGTIPKAVRVEALDAASAVAAVSSAVDPGSALGEIPFELLSVVPAAMPAGGNE